MKYKIGERTVKAVYDENSSRNPLITALPEPIQPEEFNTLIASFPVVPVNTELLKFAERKHGIAEIPKVFIPLDFMYSVYDQLWTTILGSYNTKTAKENLIRINKIFAGENDLASYGVQTQAGSLLGYSGIGKTSTIKRCLTLLPQVIEHEMYLREPFFCKQILYLFVGCPADASIKTLIYSLLHEIDMAVGDKYEHTFASLNITSTSAAITYIKILFMTFNVGIVCVDEIQNLISGTKRLKPLIKFLTELTNDTGTAIFLCGMLTAEEVFVQEEYLKRRTRGMRLLPFKNDGVYKDFLQKLWPYQYTEKKAVLTDKLSNFIYEYSGGVPAYITKLFEESQNQALLSGRMCIDEKIIKSTVGFLAIRPEKILLVGNFISDFSASVSAEKELQSSLEINILEDKKNVKAKRLYANQRGRKISERDSNDLIAAFEAGNLKPMLIDSHMLEVL